MTASMFHLHMRSLMELKQTGTVVEYTAAFWERLHRVLDLNSDLSIKCFIDQYVQGLRDDIQAAVRPRSPSSITSASCLARIREEEIVEDVARGADKLGNSSGFAPTATLTDVFAKLAAPVQCRADHDITTTDGSGRGARTPTTCSTECPSSDATVGVFPKLAVSVDSDEDLDTVTIAPLKPVACSTGGLAHAREGNDIFPVTVGCIIMALTSCSALCLHDNNNDKHITTQVPLFAPTACPHPSLDRNFCASSVPRPLPWPSFVSDGDGERLTYSGPATQGIWPCLQLKPARLYSAQALLSKRPRCRELLYVNCNLKLLASYWKSPSPELPGNDWFRGYMGTALVVQKNWDPGIIQWHTRWSSYPRQSSGQILVNGHYMVFLSLLKEWNFSTDLSAVGATCENVLSRPSPDSFYCMQTCCLRRTELIQQQILHWNICNVCQTTLYASTLCRWARWDILPFRKCFMEVNFGRVSTILECFTCSVGLRGSWIRLLSMFSCLWQMSCTQLHTFATVSLYLLSCAWTRCERNLTNLEAVVHTDQQGDLGCDFHLLSRLFRFIVYHLSNIFMLDGKPWDPGGQICSLSQLLGQNLRSTKDKLMHMICRILVLTLGHGSELYTGIKNRVCRARLQISAALYKSGAGAVPVNNGVTNYLERSVVSIIAAGWRASAAMRMLMIVDIWPSPELPWGTHHDQDLMLLDSTHRDLSFEGASLGYDSDYDHSGYATVAIGHWSAFVVRQVQTPWDPGGFVVHLYLISGLRASRILRRRECHTQGSAVLFHWASLQNGMWSVGLAQLQENGSRRGLYRRRPAQGKGAKS